MKRMVKNGRVGDKIRLRDDTIETISFCQVVGDKTRVKTYEGSTATFGNREFRVITERKPYDYK